MDQKTQTIAFGLRVCATTLKLGVRSLNKKFYTSKLIFKIKDK